MIRKTLAVLAACALILSGISGAAAAQSGVGGTVTVDNPGEDSVTVTLSYGSSGVSAGAALSSGGNQVSSATHTSSSSGETKTLSLSTAGLSQQNYNLTLTGSSESVTVQSTAVVSTQKFNYTAGSNESITADIGFSGQTNTSGDIIITDSAGTEVTNVSVDYVASEYGSNSTVTTVLTAGENISVAADSGNQTNLTATFTVQSAGQFDGAWIETGSSGGLFSGGLTGLTDGASDQQLIGLLLVGVGLLYARSEGWI
jgi:hypothetical protein